MSLDWYEIHYRWERCEPVGGVAFLANDRAVLLKEPHGGELATVIDLRAMHPEPEYEVQLLASGDRLVRPESHLASPVPSEMADCVAWIQKWYATQCDGDWEHQKGVSIGTLDNPGWLVKIDLAGTELETAKFTKVERLGPERAWLSCQTVEARWEGAGGPHMLGEILALFVRWAQEHRSSV